MKYLILIFSLTVWSNSITAKTNESVVLAHNYLEAFLSKNYDSVLNFVDISTFTNSPDQTMWNKIASMEDRGVITKEAKVEMLEGLSEQGLPESELKLITNREYISYILIEMFKLQEGGYDSATQIDIEHINSFVKENNEHHTFKTTVTLSLKDGSNEIRHMVDYRTVTINDTKIVIPSKVRFLTESFIKPFSQ